MMHREDKIFVGIIAACALGFLVLCYGALRSAQISAQCVVRGYPSSKTLFGSEGFTGYCVKRVDQTDVVVPLEER